jgi:hypothetical protein
MIRRNLEGAWVAKWKGETDKRNKIPNELLYHPTLPPLAFLSQENSNDTRIKR